MQESREFKGVWYLPGKEEKSVAGSLYYKKGDSIKLELIGSLLEELNPFFGFLSKGPREQNIIFGESSDGKKITLINCVKGASSYNTSCSFPLTSFKCQYIVVGKHLAEPDEKCFNEVWVLTPALSQWSPYLLVRHEINFEGEGNTVSSIQVSVPNKQEVHAEVELNSRYKLSLVTSGTMSGQETYPDYFKINQITYFTIQSTLEKVSFFELLDQVILFIEFLSLATYSDQYPIEIKLYDEDDFTLSKNGKRLNEIELLKINRNVGSKINRAGFLFMFHEIENDFSSIMQMWYNHNKELAPIRSHLLDSIKPKPTFTSLDFLIIVQALEGYHTRFINKKRISLKSRIEDLMALYSPDIIKIAKMVLDVQVVVNTRDYYSHFFEMDTREFVKDGVELFWLTKKLRLLLVCCILDLIGFSKQKINEIINKRDLFDFKS